MFIAGYEIEFAKVRGDTLKRAGYAWIVALALGLAVALGFAAGDFSKAIVSVPRSPVRRSVPSCPYCATPATWEPASDR